MQAHNLHFRSIRGTLHSEEPEPLVKVAEILRATFLESISLSDVRPNCEADGYPSCCQFIYERRGAQKRLDIIRGML